MTSENGNGNGLAVYNGGNRLPAVAEVQRSAGDVVAMTKLVAEVMRAVMQNGQHYGVIPGCGDKPALLKPGAEKLCLTFRLAAMPEVTWTDLGNGHRECRVLCKMVHIPTSEVWGVGVGCCSTMESKYRWRGGGRVCPQCKVAAVIKGKAEYGGGWLCFDKKGGCKAKWADSSEQGKAFEKVEAKVENPDLADQYNTVLKMAKKRAIVDATLTATAASDIFTQDIEELVETEAGMQPAAPPASRETPKPEPKPNGKAPTARDELRDAVAMWSCLKAEDVPAAMRDAIKAAGVTPKGKQITDDEAKLVLAWMEPRHAQGMDFITAVQGEQS